MPDRKRVVLVVDDNRLVCRMLHDALTEAGYIAHTTSTGADALMVMEWSRPDIMAVDRHMPGACGIRVTEAVRLHQDTRLATVPIIGFSSDDSDSGRAFLEAGADEVLPKPFSKERLIATIERLLRRGPAGASPPPTSHPVRAR